MPLRDYAMVGDLRTAALVGRDGAVDWLCLPRFDAPAALGRLVDARQGGFLQVAPRAPHGVSRRYAGDSAVLETEFETARGRVRLTDFMPVDTGNQGPQLLRRVEGLAGEVDLDVVFRPGLDFARSPARLRVRDALVEAWDGTQAVGLRAPARFVPSAEGGLTARFSLRAGQRRWVCLTSGADRADVPRTDAWAEAAREATLAFWRHWVGRGDYAGPHAPLLRRSAVTLKMLIHAPSGSFVAAPTTSLPECACGTRNWDYRYVWLRDSAWVMNALMSLGYQTEAEQFLAWLESLRLDARPPRVLYDVDGGQPQSEQCLTHLDGYRGARPVRVGNGADTQVQLDIFGDVITAAFLFFQTAGETHPMRLSAWRMVRALATQAARRWHEKDQGLWEQRCKPRHYVSSKLLCWVAVDRALRLSQRYGLDGGPLGEWAQARDALREVLETHGFNPRVGAFTHALGEESLDASVLLMSMHGFLPASDPRMRSTVARVREGLAQGALVHRYRHADGLPGQEGAFLTCGFWLVNALALQGQLDEAQAHYEQLLGLANDVGLLSEELDPETGDFLGNFPQGLTHLALLYSGQLLARLTGQSGRCAMLDARCSRVSQQQPLLHL